MRSTRLETVDTDVAIPQGTPQAQIDAYKGLVTFQCVFDVWGRSSYHQEKYSEAEGYFRKSIDAYPAQPDPVVVLAPGAFTGQADEYPDALKEANQAVELTPGGNRGWNTGASGAGPVGAVNRWHPRRYQSGPCSETSGRRQSEHDFPSVECAVGEREGLKHGLQTSLPNRLTSGRPGPSLTFLAFDHEITDNSELEHIAGLPVLPNGIAGAGAYPHLASA